MLVPPNIMAIKLSEDDEFLSVGDVDCCTLNTIAICFSELDEAVSETVEDILEEHETDGDLEVDKLIDVVFETVGEPTGEKLTDTDGEGVGESKLINILNVYLHTGLSITNVIVVVAPY